jgi:cell division septum initiation protein DivIVA
MDVEFLIERLEKYLLEESTKLPFGNRLIDEDEVRAQLTQLRTAVPEEVAQAREVVRQQEAILAQAEQKATAMLAEAEEQVRRSAGEQRVVQEARQQAAIVREKATQEAEAMRADADEYAFDALGRLQEELTRLQRVVENGLRKLEAERERRLQE